MEEEGCSSIVEFLCDDKEGRREDRVVGVKKVDLVEICRELGENSSLRCFRKKQRNGYVVLFIRRAKCGFL